MKTPKRKTAVYRVWIEQVNQTFVDVRARGPDEAKSKGYAKWRRDEAHSRITYCEKVQQP